MIGTIRKVTTIILLTLFSACAHRTGKQSFDEFRMRVSDEVFVDFPFQNADVIDSRAEVSALMPASIYVTHYCGIFISFKYDSADFQAHVERLNEKKTFSSLVKDSCNLSVTNEPLTNRGICDDSKYLPVPNLHDEFNGLSEVMFSDTDKFYVFRAMAGTFIKSDPEFISEADLSNTVSLSNGWQDGFSNGAILNNRDFSIIYWVIVW